MTRHIVLDTETTGLEVERGHRVIELGCVELVDRRDTGNTFHRYLNPGRAVDPGAVAVHGITDEFLRDKPPFAEVAADFVAFIEGAELLIHNAAFDTGFLDEELRRAGALGRVAEHATIVDTLALARRKYPGQKNTLDALCKRLGVDNRHREVHGALLDAHLLADVWLAMTVGQGALELAGVDPVAVAATAGAQMPVAAVGVRLRIQHATAADIAAHAARLDALEKSGGRPSAWRRAESPGSSDASPVAAKVDPGTCR